MPAKQPTNAPRAQAKARGFRLAALFLGFTVALILGELLVIISGSVRVVGPVFTTYDPDCGQRLRPSMAGTLKTPHFKMRMTTNALGHRGPEHDSPPRGVVYCLGDSFTMGFGVNDGEEYPQRLAALLCEQWGEDAPPVINAGLGNTGNGRWIKLLRADAPSYEPRLVILQVCHNDPRDNIGERFFDLSPAGELMELTVPPPPWQRRAQCLLDAIPWIQQSHMIALGKQVLQPTRHTVQRDGSLEAAHAHRLTAALIDGSLAICRQNDWPVVVLTAGLHDVEHGAPVDSDASEDNDAADDRLLQRWRPIAARYGAAVVTTPTKNRRPDLFYVGDSHWNAAGHQDAAERLLPHVLTVIARSAQFQNLGRTR